MALFKVRPSRGSWAFFFLITAAAVTNRQWKHHEQQIIRSDGPAAESARALATCLFGPDVAWMLREDEPAELARAGVPQAALWTARSGRWLQSHAGASLQYDWPARCVAPLDELEGRLRSASQHLPNTASTIAQVRTALLHQPPARPGFGHFGDGPAARAVEGQNLFLKSVDDNSLPALLGSLFSDVRDLSSGTRDRWSAVPFHAEQFPMPPAPVVPVWRDVRENPAHAPYEQVVLASPTVFFYRSRVDGLTHRVDFDRRARNDTPLGAAVAWQEPPRGGVLRASTEAGGAVIPMEPTPRVVALPDEPGVTRRGGYFDWQAAANADGLAWLTLAEGGTVRLRAMRFEDPARWSEPVTLGAPGNQLALVAPEPLDASRWRVTLLRSPVVDRSIEQYVVEVTGAGLTVMPGLRRELTRLPALPQLLTCGSEAVRYVALLGSARVAVLRIEGDQILVAQRAMTSQWGAEPVLRCDAGRALVVSDPPTMNAAAVVVTFPVGRDPSVETVPALPYDRGSRLREVLLVDDGLVAIAAHAASLRAWRLPLQGAQWEAGGYLAGLTPALDTTRLVRSLRGVSQGRSLAVWAEGDSVERHNETVPNPTDRSAAPTTHVVEAKTPFRVLMMSEDSGRSFAGF